VVREYTKLKGTAVVMYRNSMQLNKKIKSFWIF
jgi:hypothetical protein